MPLAHVAYLRVVERNIGGTPWPCQRVSWNCHSISAVQSSPDVNCTDTRTAVKTRYNTVLGLADLHLYEFSECSPHCGSRGHKYKLYKKCPGTRISSEFFSERNKLSVYGMSCLSPLILAQLLALKVIF